MLPGAEQVLLSSSLRHVHGQAVVHPREPQREDAPHPSVSKAARQLCPMVDSRLRSLMACLLSSFASSGHNRHVPGAGCQHLPAGVPGCGQGQGQRRDDDLLPQWRAPTQLVAASQMPGSPASREMEMASVCAKQAGGSPRSSPGGRADEIFHFDSRSSFCLCGRAAAPGPGVPVSCEHQADQRRFPL